MDKLKVEYWPTDKLIEYVRNPRKNDEQVPRMVAAIKEFGFRIPVVAKSDGTLVDGHLRLKAARALGMKEVPVALADELTPTQVKAFRLLANQSANWASWDADLLKLEVDDLKIEGFDVDLIGLDEDDFNRISYIDELLESGVCNEKKAEFTTFEVSLLFPIEKKETVKKFIKDKSEEYVVNMILSEAERHGN